MINEQYYYNWQVIAGMARAKNWSKCIFLKHSEYEVSETHRGVEENSLRAAGIDCLKFPWPVTGWLVTTEKLFSIENDFFFFHIYPDNSYTYYILLQIKFNIICIMNTCIHNLKSNIIYF